MLRIVVCEDNSKYLEGLSHVIQEILKEEGIPGEIVLKTHSTAAVEEAIKGGDANVFFLDIDLGQGADNGFELARKIRGADEKAFIVFITEHLEYVLQSFKIRTFDFLPKPVTANQLKNTIKNIYKHYLMLNGTASPGMSAAIRVKFGADVYYFDPGDIALIEKFRNKSVVHTNRSSVTCYESLENFEAVLKEKGSFLRCHKSYLINRTYISEIHFNRMEIVLNTGHVCHIGRKYKHAVSSMVNGEAALG